MDRSSSEGRAGGPRSRVWAAISLGAVTGLVAAGLLTSLPRSVPARLWGSAVWGTGRRAAPEFVLRDQGGRPASLRDLRGRIVLLTFMDSRCRKACPIEGRMLRRAVDALPRRDRPVLLLVSVNTADTAASARRFAEKAGFAGSAPWHWLMGSRASLAPIWKAYGVGVKPVRGDIEHTTVLYVIDGHGDERAAFGVPFIPSLVAADIRGLDREAHPGWRWPWG